MDLAVHHPTLGFGLTEKGVEPKSVKSMLQRSASETNGVETNGVTKPMGSDSIDETNGVRNQWGQETNGVRFD